MFYSVTERLDVAAEPARSERAVPLESAGVGDMSLLDASLVSPKSYRYQPALSDEYS
jgi:hypothetical protein